jgi:protocatechuate 3,4-dioxygenase beta subunit
VDVCKSGNTFQSRRRTYRDLVAHPTACVSNLTPAQAEGPFFKAGSPEKKNLLEEGMKGTKLTISGYVMNTGCQPVKQALLDFWQADVSGNYDKSGYTLRGHQYTDDEGRFTLQTVIPGLYPGRPENLT